jgi:hypothetical protein
MDLFNEKNDCILSVNHALDFEADTSRKSGMGQGIKIDGL